MSERSGQEEGNLMPVCDGGGQDTVPDTGGLWQRRLVSEHPAEGVMTVRDPGRDLCPAAAVQEGPSGIRDVSGIGFRRRGRATRRRYRNEAGQFISMVTFFEAQGATSGAQDARGQGTCRRGRPPRKYRKRKVAITAEVTLFEMVALGKNSVQTAVEEWVQSYKEDRELALLDLISFFVQCCGCEGMVTAELYQTNQGNSVVHKMTEKFDQETGLYYKKFLAYPWILTIMWPEKLQNDFYPIVGPGPFWKRFRVNFCEFTELLVQQTHSSVLCDGHLMDTVICMLSGLTNSAVHSLRHTSSLAAMKLLTALASCEPGHLHEQAQVPAAVPGGEHRQTQGQTQALHGSTGPAQTAEQARGHRQHHLRAL
ncbi:cohesin subunit SA-1-like isoform X1 [Panthera pardus]|uniref:Cohesin subunit SA-1-like isoform X1 n=1 Tax=Panthera pardus TaxID=9691 RepID=A0A9W2UMD7_PANPR|nr:cohesin subunit SA-1-like isoform X1 [Panthera pardus]